MFAQILLGVTGGSVLVLGFLGGLWLAADRVTSAHAGRGMTLFVLSALARVALVAAGFVALARFAGPVAAAVGLATFVLIRTLVVARMRTPISSQEG